MNLDATHVVAKYVEANLLSIDLEILVGKVETLVQNLNNRLVLDQIVFGTFPSLSFVNIDEYVDSVLSVNESIETFRKLAEIDNAIFVNDILGQIGNDRCVVGLADSGQFVVRRIEFSFLA